MSTETEEFIADEVFQTEREADAEIEHDFEHESPEETEREDEESEDSKEEKEVLEPGLQAVLDQKGGEKDDWILEYRGDSGYHFDGEHVRDPDGNVWTNEDTALHQEMLTQWTEGGNSIFFLPDYRELTEDRDTLFVTMMVLGEKGEVTYEIHKFETLKETYENDTESSEEGTDTETRYADLSEEEDEPALAEESFEYSVFETEMQMTGTESASTSEEPSQEVHVAPGFEAHSTETHVTRIGLAEHGTEQVRNTDTTGKNGPDQWLVDLLKVDSELGDLEMADAFVQKSANHPFTHEEGTITTPQDERSIQGDHSYQEPVTFVSNRGADVGPNASTTVATITPSAKTWSVEPPVFGSHESQTEQCMTADVLESMRAQQQISQMDSIIASHEQTTAAVERDLVSALPEAHVVEIETSVTAQEAPMEISGISMPQDETLIVENVVNVNENHDPISSLGRGNVPRVDPTSRISAEPHSSPIQNVRDHGNEEKVSDHPKDEILSVPQQESTKERLESKHEHALRTSGAAKPQANEHGQFPEPSRDQDRRDLEQTRELPHTPERVKAEEILRVLGLPTLTASTESFGIRRIRDDVPYIPPTRTRVDMHRDSRAAKISERYGITMEMVA